MKGLSYLDSLAKWDQKSPFGLEVPRRLLAELGDPQDAVPAVHVGGTNGKGTTCSYVAAMLIASGKRVAQFASPHLMDITERLIIDGAPVDPLSLSDALLVLRRAAERSGVTPSAFEAVVLASFLIARELKLDCNVVEVGLGGRLDATNTMRAPRVTALSSIGFDHMHYLGNTLGEIAGEKAQIFRRGVPAIVSRVDAEAAEVIRTTALQRGAPLKLCGEEFEVDLLRGELRCSGWKFELPVQELQLIADHQLLNAALAVRIGHELGLAPGEIRTGLCSARWPGRLEQLSWQQSDGPIVSVLLDGAHNPQGAAALVQYLERRYRHAQAPRRIVFVVSILEAKDRAAIRQAFDNGIAQFSSKAPSSFEWVFTESGSRGATSAADLCTLFDRGTAISDPHQALAEAARRAGGDGLVVVTGSLHLLGRLRKELTPQAFSTLSR